MALIDSLISYWKLEEGSGTRADSHGTMTLSQTGGVGSAAGKLGTAADFDGTNDILTHADHADLSTGDIDFSIAGWIYSDDVAVYGDLVGKWGGDSSVDEYQFTQLSNGKLRWYVTSSGSALTTVDSTNALSASTWYHVACWHDSVNNQIGISINAGTADTAAHTTGVRDGTNQFAMGNRSSGNPFNGRMDGVGFWKKVLSSAERTELYNSGAGLEYPFSTGAGLRRRRNQPAAREPAFEFSW